MNLDCPAMLNNLAVHHLVDDSEKVSDAARLLRSALESVHTWATVPSNQADGEGQLRKQDTGIPEEHQDRSIWTSRGFPTDHVEGHEQVHLESSAVGPKLLATLAPAFEHTPIALFDRAFKVYGHRNNDELVIAALLYNMGLVRHLCSLRNAGRGLTGALELYKMSLHYVQLYDLSSSVARPLAMGLYNNIAHIHSYNLSLQESKESIDQLSFLLACPEACDCVKEDDFAIFYLNAVIYMANQTSPAAAAA